jgi:hypothetical protein
MLDRRLLSIRRLLLRVAAIRKYLLPLIWMGGRAVEGTGLENRQACERLVGSNPTPSAIACREVGAGMDLQPAGSADAGSGTVVFFPSILVRD